jgi:hypothetical protein
MSKRKPKPIEIIIDRFGDYPGYWTELVYLHNWPPNFTPRDDWGKSSVAASEIASRNRDGRVALGDHGSIIGLSKASDARLAKVSRPDTVSR